MKCPKCGKEIANDSNFCEYCGNPIRRSLGNKIISTALVVILLLLVGWLSYLFGKQSSEPTYVGAEEIACDSLVSESSEYIDLGLPSGTLWKDANETDDYFTYEEAVNRFGDKQPTKEQWEELQNKCEWTWNRNGYKVTGPNGNSIVLPAAGFRFCDGDVGGVGSYGDYWSSTPGGSETAWYLGFNSGHVGMSIYDRCGGRSVRLVQD